MKHSIQNDPKSKRSVGRKAWALFAKLPLFLRGPLIRRLFSVEAKLPANLVFKKADTPKEIEQAFNIAFEGYHQRGLVEDSDSRLRVTKYHALPTTCILIAKEDDEVIATVTIVVDSALGLPLEQLWDINEIRKSSPRIAEVSTLSIRKDHRSRRGKLLLPLMDFMQRYCLHVLGAEKIVASMHPEVADFYRCVLLFNMINKGEVKTYEFVQGAAAVAGWLSLSELPVNYKKVYGNRPSNKNLLHFFTQAPPANYIFEVKKFKGCSEFSFTPSLLEYFFKHKTEVLAELSPRDRNIIANTYFLSQFTTIITDGHKDPESFNRVQARFAVFYTLSFHVARTNKTYSGHALDISRTGLRVYIPEAFPLAANDEITLTVELGRESVVPLKAVVAWEAGSIGQVGLELTQFTPKAWQELVSHFEEELGKKTREETARPKVSNG